MAESWALKLLSGPHIGAEITLDPGTWILGRDPECDLVLADDSLSERHLELTVDKEAVRLKSLHTGNSVYLSGELQGSDCTLPPYEIALVGGLYLAIGHAGQPWPELSATAPLVPPQGKDTAGEKATPELADSPASTADSEILDEILSDTETATVPVLEEEVPASAFETASQKPAEATAPAPAAQPEKTAQSATEAIESPPAPAWTTVTEQLKAQITKTLTDALDWCRQNPLLLGASGLASILALLITGFVWLWTLTDPQTIARDNITPAQQAEAIISQMNIADIKLASLPDESVLISGYVPDNTTREQLQTALENAEVPYSFRAVVMNDMRASAAAVLEQHNFAHMSVELDTTPGSLVLSGYAADAEEAERVRNTLMEEVHGLRFLADQVEYQATRIKALRTLLKEKNLGQTIELLETPDKVILRGKLNDVTQGYKLKDVVQTFRSKYKNRPQLHIDASLPSTDIASMQPLLAIRSISLGQVPYVILQNGEKYLRGAKLSNGYILENISLEYLTLRLGDERMKYFIGGQHGKR